MDASLTFSIDSSQAVSAVAQLQALFQASVQAAQGQQQLNQATSAAAQVHMVYARELSGTADAATQLNFAQRQLARTLYDSANSVSDLTRLLREQQMELNGSATSLANYAMALQNVANVARLMGQTVPQLQSFAQTGGVLGVPDQNMQVAYNRMSVALENQTGQGAQIRDLARQLGVDVTGMQTGQEGDLMRRLTEALRGMAPSAELTRRIGLLFGPMDAQSQAALFRPDNEQPYENLGERQAQRVLLQQNRLYGNWVQQQQIVQRQDARLNATINDLAPWWGTGFTAMNTFDLSRLSPSQISDLVGQLPEGSFAQRLPGTRAADAEIMGQLAQNLARNPSDATALQAMPWLARWMQDTRQLNSQWWNNSAGMGQMDQRVATAEERLNTIYGPIASYRQRRDLWRAQDLAGADYSEAGGFAAEDLAQKTAEELKAAVDKVFKDIQQEKRIDPLTAARLGVNYATEASYATGDNDYTQVAAARMALANMALGGYQAELNAWGSPDEATRRYTNLTNRYLLQTRYGGQPWNAAFDQNGQQDWLMGLSPSERSYGQYVLQQANAWGIAITPEMLASSGGSVGGLIGQTPFQNSQLLGSLSAGYAGNILRGAQSSYERSRDQLSIAQGTPDVMGMLGMSAQQAAQYMQQQIQWERDLQSLRQQGMEEQRKALEDWIDKTREVQTELRRTESANAHTQQFYESETQTALTRARLALPAPQQQYGIGAARLDAAQQILQTEPWLAIGQGTANYLQGLSIDQLFTGVVGTESNGRQFDAQGRPLTSSANAIGVSQIQPATAAEAYINFRRQHPDWGTAPYDFETTDASALARNPQFLQGLKYNTTFNELLGRQHLSDMVDLFGGDRVLGTLAYFKGQGRVQGWIDQYGRPGQRGVTYSDFLQHLPGPPLDANGKPQDLSIPEYLARTITGSGGDSAMLSDLLTALSQGDAGDELVKSRLRLVQSATDRQNVGLLGIVNRSRDNADWANRNASQLWSLSDQGATAGALQLAQRLQYGDPTQMVPMQATDLSRLLQQAAGLRLQAPIQLAQMQQAAQRAGVLTQAYDVGGLGGAAAQQQAFGVEDTVQGYAAAIQRLRNMGTAVPGVADEIDRMTGEMLKLKTAAQQVTAAQTQERAAQMRTNIGQQEIGSITDISHPFAGADQMGFYQATAQAEAYNAANPGLTAEQRQQNIRTMQGQANLTALKSQVDSVRQSFMQMGDAVGNAFDTMITGGQNGSRTMLQLSQSIEQILLKVAVNDPLQRLFSGALDSAANATGLNSIFSSMAKSTAGGSTASASGPSLFQGLGNAIGNFGIGSALSSAWKWAGSLFAAQGALVEGGYMVPFASGGLIDRPTLIPMANGGTGLAGEVSTEGLVPLRRLPNGDLGVQTSGHGAGGPITIHAPITVQGSQVQGGKGLDQATVMALQRQLSQTVYTSVKSILVDELRPGGTLYLTSNQAPY